MHVALLHRCCIIACMNKLRLLHDIRRHLLPPWAIHVDWIDAAWSTGLILHQHRINIRHLLLNWYRWQMFYIRPFHSKHVFFNFSSWMLLKHHYCIDIPYPCMNTSSLSHWYCSNICTTIPWILQSYCITIGSTYNQNGLSCKLDPSTEKRQADFDDILHRILLKWKSYENPSYIISYCLYSNSQ